MIERGPSKENVMLRICRGFLFFSCRFLAAFVVSILLVILIFSLAIATVKAYSYFEPISDYKIPQKTKTIRVWNPALRGVSFFKKRGIVFLVFCSFERENDDVGSQWK